MEKWRLARINASLILLQTTILNAHGKDQRRSAHPEILGKYWAVFKERLSKMNSFLTGCEGEPAGCRHQLELRCSRAEPRCPLLLSLGALTVLLTLLYLWKL